MFYNSIFNICLYTNIHVSIAMCMMVYSTGIFIDENTAILGVFAGCSTLLSYNSMQYLKINSFTKTPFTNPRKILFLVNILAFILWGYCLSLLPFLKVLKTLLPAFIITVAYRVPIGYFNKKKYTLRNIPFIKIFSISAAWAFVSVVFPVQMFCKNWDTPLVHFLMHQTSFIFALCLPFDVRDLPTDDKNLKTIPQVFGIEKTKIIGFILTFISLIFALKVWQKNYYFAVILTHILLSLGIGFCHKKTKYYCNFWGESILILNYVFLTIS